MAESVKSNPAVKGVGKTSHKMYLFTDDIILALTEVELSLAKVVDTLQKFGELSY